MNRIEMLMELVLTNPLALLLLEDPKDIIIINELLPYSTGFEIECDQGSTFKTDYFLKIPHIIAVECDLYEQRFRIPNGINGILCLYMISIQAKVHLKLNDGSGIHYHNDFTDIKATNKIVILKEKESYILEELGKWKYTGKGNKLEYGYAYKYNGLDTIEYRRGMMTFDYRIWIEKILHCNRITKYIKEKHYKDQIKSIEYTLFDSQVFLTYLRNIKNGYTIIKKSKEQYQKEIIDKNKIVNNRVIKL